MSANANLILQYEEYVVDNVRLTAVHVEWCVIAAHCSVLFLLAGEGGHAAQAELSE